MYQTTVAKVTFQKPLLNIYFDMLKNMKIAKGVYIVYLVPITIYILFILSLYWIQTLFYSLRPGAVNLCQG